MRPGGNGESLRGASGWKTRIVGPRDGTGSGPRPLTAAALDDAGVRAANQELIVDPEVNRMITRYGKVVLAILLGIGGVIGAYAKLHGFNDSPRAPKDPFTLTDPDADHKLTCLREAAFDKGTNAFSRNRWAAENCAPVEGDLDEILAERNRLLQAAAGLPSGSVKWWIDGKEGTMRTEVDSSAITQAYRDGSIK